MSKKKILMIIIGVIVTLIMAVGAGLYFLMSEPSAPDGAHETEKTQKAEKKKKEHKKEDLPVFMKLEPITTNLRGDDAAPEGSMLQVTFQFALHSEKDQVIVQSYLPKIRSEIILILAGLTKEIVLKDPLSSHKSLTDKIKSRGNAILEDELITDVLIDQIIIQ